MNLVAGLEKPEPLQVLYTGFTAISGMPMEGRRRI